MFSSLAKQIDSTRHLHQFRHPVASRHQRVDPFNASDPRAGLKRRGAITYVLHSRLQIRDRSRTGRLDTRGARHVGNIAPHIDEGIGPQ